jgi:hypothetical protein
MTEIMFDLETLDTKPSAVVLSVGAVAWDTEYGLTDRRTMKYIIKDRFYRIIKFDAQLEMKRTVSEDTLLWWHRQDKNSIQEAFNSVRVPLEFVLSGLYGFFRDHNLNSAWAAPATFDFPIWENLSDMYDVEVPWKYNKKYDVHTVVKESGLSARDVIYEGSGVAHTPIYDCERQINLLTKARETLKFKKNFLAKPVKT